jgi:hypothetical protein
VVDRFEWVDRERRTIKGGKRRPMMIRNGKKTVNSGMVDGT